MDEGVAEYVVSDEELHARIPNSSTLSVSKFDQLLRLKWECAAANGVLRYQLPDLMTKVLAGQTRFVAQLNTKRALQRRSPGHMTHLHQPFDPEQFNFTKIKPIEILFSFVEQVQGCSTDCDDTFDQNIVIVNVSPLEYCNVLLVPRPSACQPQVLTADSLRIAIVFALSSKNRGFRVAFNSLCAFASVNHLHFHGYYLDQCLPCETWEASHIAGPCHELVGYPARAFVFFYEGNVESLARSIHQLSNYCHFHNIAHNLMITRGHDSLHNDSMLGLRVILWPRKSSLGVKSSSAFNVAVCELAGHLPIYNEEDYHTMTDEKACLLLSQTAVSQEEFQQIKVDVIEIFK